MNFQQLIDLARIPLNDAAKERYQDTELLAYAKDGLREAAVLRPDLFAVRGQITCSAGVEQVVPAGAWFLTDILHNHLGDEVYEADYQTFRGFNPTWRNDDPAPAEIWMRYPVKGPDNRFLVHPPARANDQLDAIYAVCNVANLTVADNVPIDDVYLSAIQYYVTARAEAVDDQHTVTQRTAQLAAAFAQLLGVGAKTEEVRK